MARSGPNFAVKWENVDYRERNNLKDASANFQRRDRTDRKQKKLL